MPASLPTAESEYRHRSVSPNRASAQFAEDESPPSYPPPPAVVARRRLPSPPPAGFSAGKSFWRPWWARNKGLTLVLLSEAFGSLMSATVRLLETNDEGGKGMHPFQILFARMSITCILSSIYMVYVKVPDAPLGARGIRGWLVVRGIAGFLGANGLYFSLRYLPIAEATVIAFLLPYFTCWACSIILHDPFTRKAQLAGIVSFLGVILIAHPTSFFAKSPDGPPGPSPQTTSVTPSQRLLGVMMGLAGAVFGAGAYTTIRYIGKRAHPLISVTYYSLMCTVVTMILLIFIPGIGFQLPANLRQWGLLISLGVFGFLLQFLMTAGLQLDNSNRVMNMLYIQIVFALALDKLIWGTLPDWMSIAGGILVLTSTIYAAMQKSAATVVTTSEVASEEELGLMQSLDHDDDVANGEESLATGVDEDI